MGFPKILPKPWNVILRRRTVLDRAILELRKGNRFAERGDFIRAFAWFARAARGGLPEAQYRVGRCYAEGIGVPCSYTEATRWLGRSAAQGLVEAQVLLASLIIQRVCDNANTAAAVNDTGAPALSVCDQHRKGVFGDYDIGPLNYNEALRLAKLAGQAGSARGQALAGFILSSGPEEMRDFGQARQWYALSAAAGCPVGMLGYALAKGQVSETAKDDQENEMLLKKAADAGLPTAMFVLGIRAERGTSSTPDPAAAAQFFCAAAKQGHRSAQTKWGLSLLSGVGVPADQIEGETWLRRAAHAGSADAAAALGELYTRHDILPPNYAEAAMWLVQAADAGHPRALCALARLHLTGAGVSADPTTATALLIRAADAGDRQAKVELADMILDGKAESVGAERMRKWFHEATDDCDLVASFKLGICLAKQSIKSHSRYDSVDLCRLANDGVSVAQYRYGRMLIESRGPDMNPIAGRVWIARAAESDAVDAIVYLGYLQLTGIAGEKDHLASHALFKRAAEKGHIGAMVALATLYCGGNGVPTDRNFAKHWFHNAAARGSRTARLMLMRHFSPFSADNVIRCQGLSDAAPAHLNG